MTKNEIVLPENLEWLEEGEIASVNDRVYFRGEFTRAVGLNSHKVLSTDLIARFKKGS